METTVEQPKKRRGRPPKAKPCEHVWKAVETGRPGIDPMVGMCSKCVIPMTDDVVDETIGSPRKLAKPSAPMLAKEIVDFIVSKYEMAPGDWRMVLTSLAYVQRLGRYWSEQTRK